VTTRYLKAVGVALLVAVAVGFIWEAGTLGVAWALGERQMIAARDTGGLGAVRVMDLSDLAALGAFGVALVWRLRRIRRPAV
jgi:hypothetical protein